MNSIKSFLLATRPKTLSASLVPCLSSAFLVYGLGYHVEFNIFLYALFSSICIQIGTNLVNDAKDFKKGADTEERIGPMRVTQAGHFSYFQVMSAAGVFFLLAILLGIPLVIHGGTPIIAIGLLSVLMGYAYTSGPFPLAYKGLGDLFVILFFGLVAVMGLSYLLTLTWTFESFILGLQTGFHGTVLIAINNLRDRDGDIKVNKKTLAVRFGETFSKWEITLLLFIPYLLNSYWSFKLFPWTSLIALASLPLATWLSVSIWKTKPGPVYNRFLGFAALHQLLFAVLVSGSLLLKA